MYFIKKAINTLSCICMLFALPAQVIAQVDSVYWNFGVPATAIANATSSSNANVSAASCMADTGNVCCAFSSASGYTTLYFTTQFSSSGYTGASGQPTMRNNARTGSFNAATSTYFSFTVVPNTGYAVELKGISFAGLKNATGPTGYTVRTSVDGYTTTVGSGSLTTSYGSTKKTHSGLSISGAPGSPVTVRIYVHNPLATSTGGNVFLDDVMIYYTASLVSACNAPPAVPTGLIASNITFYDAFIKWNKVNDALSYEYAVTTSATPPSSGTNTADTFFTAPGLNDNTLYYVHVKSKCDTYASDWETINFMTDEIPPCDTPANLTALNIGIISADIDWDPVTGAIEYEYALNTSLTPPSSGTTTTSTSYAASGLNDNATYYFHLRTVCVDDHLYSDWTTISFSTLEDTTTDTFTVVTYNLLNFSGSGRETYYRTTMDSIKADIVVVQELSGLGSTAFNNFRSNVLNYSASAYSGGTFINGPDTDNGLYYKSTKFQFIDNTVIVTSLRDINQFRLKHLLSGDTLIIYSAHLKASDGAAEEAQRAAEVDALRAVTNALHSGSYFLVCGDFNIYKSSESAYQKLIGNGSNTNGKFNDLLSLSGTWNNSSYAIHHTQSPRTTSFGGGATGGLDDRFDMLLFSSAIVNAGGFDILGNSYKVYGNDGQHFNQALNTPPYTMYSSTTASALHDASDHLPVVVKLTYSPGSQKAAKVNAIAGINNTNHLIVYPNPTENVLFIRAFTDVKEMVKFNLYDLNGRVVKQLQVNGLDKNVASISLSGLVAGTYYLKTPNFNEVHKVIVK